MSVSTVTIKGNVFTVYATRTEADAFLSIDPARMDAWNVLNDEAKDWRLAYARRAIDEAGIYSGEKVDENQEGEFPRNSLTCNGEPFSSTFPLQIERASILIAGTLATNPQAANLPIPPSAAGTADISLLKAGTAELRFYDPSRTNAPAPDASATVVSFTIDTEADRLIECFFEGGAVEDTGTGLYNSPRSSGSSTGNAFGNQDRFRVE